MVVLVCNGNWSMTGREIGQVNYGCIW